MKMGYLMSVVVAELTQSTPLIWLCLFLGGFIFLRTLNNKVLTSRGYFVLPLVWDPG